MNNNFFVFFVLCFEIFYLNLKMKTIFYRPQYIWKLVWIIVFQKCFPFSSIGNLFWKHLPRRLVFVLLDLKFFLIHQNWFLIMYMLILLASRNYMVKNLAACCRMIITKDAWSNSTSNYYHTWKLKNKIDLLRAV